MGFTMVYKPTYIWGGPILQDPPWSKNLGSHLGSISQARWAADENHGLGARKKKMGDRCGE